MHTQEEILEQVRTTLFQLFEIPPERVTLNASLYDDLEIDSIDAIDLLDSVRRSTGKKISPQDFRSARTVGDIVEVMHRLFQDT
jgi:acyl carrier protein